MEYQIDTLPVEPAANDTPFELGTLLGRHQAFACIASKCSAADAHSLQEIRNRKLYRAVGLNWEDFCARHAGICSKTADKIIDRLVEFGESYFNLTQILHITVPEYRAIEPAIADNAIDFEGERIPITKENAPKVQEAIRALRHQVEKSKAECERAQKAWRFARLQSLVDRCVADVSGQIRNGIDEVERATLATLIDEAGLRIDQMLQKLGPEAAPPE